jgi:hypothetical protein
MRIPIYLYAALVIFLCFRVSVQHSKSVTVRHAQRARVQDAQGSVVSGVTGDG